VADESDNLVLVQLREIRATLAEHTSRFDQVDRRFDQLEKRFDAPIRNHALGPGTANGLKARELDARQEESEGRQKRMDALMAESSAASAKSRRGPTADVRGGFFGLPLTSTIGEHENGRS